MILFFKRNTFGYFRVTFTPVYLIFPRSMLSESNLRRIFSPECYFDSDSLLPFFPLPSALNIHKVLFTGPLSVTASVIISLPPLPVISLVQPTTKPLRCRDLRFFSLNASRSTHSFFVRCPRCLVHINYGSFWTCFSYFTNSSEKSFSPRDNLWPF